MASSEGIIVPATHQGRSIYASRVRLRKHHQTYLTSCSSLVRPNPNVWWMSKQEFLSSSNLGHNWNRSHASVHSTLWTSVLQLCPEKVVRKKAILTQLSETASLRNPTHTWFSALGCIVAATTNVRKQASVPEENSSVGNNSMQLPLWASHQTLIPAQECYIQSFSRHPHTLLSLHKCAITPARKISYF